MSKDRKVILVDCLFIVPGKNRGTQTYLDSLLRYMVKDPRVTLLCVVNKLNAEHYARIVGDNLVHMPLSGESTAIRGLFQQFTLPFLAVLKQADLLFCPGYLSPIIAIKPTVPVIHDMNFFDLESSMGRLVRLMYKWVLPFSTRTARSVMTISEFSKARIVSVLGVDPKKVSVVHEGPMDAVESVDDYEPVECELSTTRPFFLSVSGGAPHKNVYRLLKAFRLFFEQGNLKYQLVLIGHSATDEMQADFNDLIQNGSVIFTGYVSEEIKIAYFHQAYAYVFPSLYEGFGLPALEAQSSHLPLLCSKSASLPEVAGEGALYFDAEDVSSITDALSQIGDNELLRAELISKGRDNLKRFSWEKCAEETVDLLLTKC